MTTDIGQCLTAVNELAINPDAISNWQAVFSDQIFWTDSGQFFQFEHLTPSHVPEPTKAMDAGYGPQTPPQTGGEDLVFSYLYVLPDFLRTLAIFIAVAGSDDPNWVSDYGPQVLQPVAAFLKNSVHDTIAKEITQLAPSWDGKTLWEAVGINPVNGARSPPLGSGLGRASRRYRLYHKRCTWEFRSRVRRRRRSQRQAAQTLSLGRWRDIPGIARWETTRSPSRIFPAVRRTFRLSTSSGSGCSSGRSTCISASVSRRSGT